MDGKSWRVGVLACLCGLLLPVNPNGRGTKAAAAYQLWIPAASQVALQLSPRQAYAGLFWTKPTVPPCQSPVPVAFPRRPRASSSKRPTRSGRSGPPALPHRIPRDETAACPASHARIAGPR
jgi:hypothetical protein